MHEKFWDPACWKLTQVSSGRWLIHRVSGPSVKNLQIYDWKWNRLPLTTVQGRSGVENFDLRKGESTSIFRTVENDRFYRMYWIERNKWKIADIYITENISIIEVRRRQVEMLSKAESLERVNSKYAVG